ncbi:hypothetical protein [Flavobacterium sp.]|jgi:hypothetical protein|uniref:hypothetical protein n=1 Tax=Flavobacterium sp. TaxID=239 RepID=UPI0037C0DE65
MNLLKKLDLLLADLGNPAAIKRNHIDTVTESKIENVKGEKIASSINGGIWAEINELSEYSFLDIIIIGNRKMKTFEGCEIIFQGAEKELKLISDTKEIESNYSNVSNRFITEISFDITNLNIDYILDREAEIVTLKHKKEVEIFKVLK